MDKIGTLLMTLVKLLFGFILGAFIQESYGSIILSTDLSLVPIWLLSLIVFSTMLLVVSWVAEPWGR